MIPPWASESRRYARELYDRVGRASITEHLVWGSRVREDLWRRGTNKGRSQAALLLAEKLNDFGRDSVREWYTERGPDTVFLLGAWAFFAARYLKLWRASAVLGVTVGAGTDRWETAPRQGLESWASLTVNDRKQQLRLQAIRQRLLLPDGNPQRISLDKAVAWFGRAVRGGVWHGFGVGQSLTLPFEPVVRVLNELEENCSTCPAKRGWYPSFDTMVIRVGLPGDGSDECGQNCKCRVVPASTWEGIEYLDRVHF